MEIEMTEPEPSFEDLLASPVGQFDPDGELLPHLLAFGPPVPSRPWLFESAVNTTAAAPPEDATHG